MDFTRVASEIAVLNTNIVQQRPEQIAKFLQPFVEQGSKLHVLKKEDVIVFYNPKGDSPDLEKAPENSKEDEYVAKSHSGLLAAGAKFFDAAIYLSLPEGDRPTPHKHPVPSGGRGTQKIPQYNNLRKITKSILAIYFYIMIRGHPPTLSGDYKDQPMPKFISTVLGITKNKTQISEYVASFPLQHLDPAWWVKYIKLQEIGHEAMSKFGPGVAGYGLASIFNTYEPDKYKGEQAKDKPIWLDSAICVAKSFRDAGLCWDFHPATRNPNILTKYGNVNKNITNLILDSYSPKTINELMENRKLPMQLIRDPLHSEYKSWTVDKKYVATSPIFSVK
ncbi:hypothetical protein N7465_001200 [Penicillium sp. CMV-2018d]|nr:hypothetical protein N7465_001200 [Penicillium sp. CMV-2018d]